MAFFLRLAAAAIAIAVPLRGDDPPDRYRESVSADRVVVDVRVIDNTGAPIAGLGAGDFELRVDGNPSAIESLEWVTSASPAAPLAIPLAETDAFPGPPAAAPPAAAGRLIVLFFQTDYEPSRITGQMRMIRQALAFLDTCSADDRLAVLSFDSRLKLRQDFTSDREKLRRAVVRTLYTDDVRDAEPGGFPSLAASLDFHAARRATLPEHALRVIGQGLSALPGSKSLLFFGWGIGNFDPIMGLILDHNYGPAALALIRSHTSVFVLDVTSAGFHSMEGGLEAIAADTGGMYVKTHVFPKFAMQKVARAITGYYLLTFAPPRLRHGRHEIAIRVAGHRQASVLARSFYWD